MKPMRILCLFVVLLAVSSVSADDHKYYLSLRGGLTALSGGDSAKFAFDKSWGGALGFRAADRWLLDLGFTIHRNYNDTLQTSTFAVGSDDSNATLRWKAGRIGCTLNRFLFGEDNLIRVLLGAGGGLMIWEYVDPAVDTAVDVRGALNERTNYAATEIFLTGATGLEIMFSPQLSVSLGLQADYLTGAGAEFQDAVNAVRDRWQLGSFVSLNYHFGSRQRQTAWRSDAAWSNATETTARTEPWQALDADGDGIPNDIDRCLDTAPGVIVDQYGCSIDSDADGVSDGLDDCPGTDPAAAGRVDIYGCPVDSDFDGVPDYADACPFNREGAHVDQNGCPLDSDADGVPDGLDDCPYTLYGADVDQFGCIDLTVFAKPMVLNIDYPSGSFEIDPNSAERLKALARVLNFVPVIRLEISGYTDNIGTESANQRLSEKRANRVRDYLVAQGVSADRIQAFGMGETNFVTTNQTAEGRAKNRRIEIVFYR